MRAPFTTPNSAPAAMQTTPGTGGGANMDNAVLTAKKLCGERLRVREPSRSYTTAGCKSECRRGSVHVETVCPYVAGSSVASHVCKVLTSIMMRPVSEEDTQRPRDNNGGASMCDMTVAAFRVGG